MCGVEFYKKIHNCSKFKSNQIAKFCSLSLSVKMWDEDDFRLIRFINKEKQINEHFAIDLIADVPPVQCKDRVVSCDGGDGPLGHPRVFINLDQPGAHSCVYCGIRFEKIDDHHH